ncbi:MAG: hypothetical protein WBF33_01420 [Candidatus Nitrosopolaris sp.]
MEADNCFVTNAWKVIPEVEETIIDLRLTKRFGCNRIKFRLRRIIGLSLSTRIHIQDSKETWS